MSKISNKKRKFIKRNFKQLSLEELAHKTGLNPKTVRSLIDEYNDETSKKNHIISKYSNSISDLDNKRWFYVIRIVALAIFLLTFMVYIPALENDFVCWDDNEYVYENTRMQSLNLQSLSFMFTSFHASNWHPMIADLIKSRKCRLK